MPAWLQHMLLCLQGYDYFIHYHPCKEMALPDTLSHFSPCPGPNIPLDIAIHHAHLSPEWKEAFPTSLHEWSWDVCSHWHYHPWLPRWHKGSPSPLTPILATSWDSHHWRWPCPPWRSPHCSSFGKGENTISTAPVPSRNHQSPVAHMWMHLLAKYKQSQLKKLSISVRPAPGSKPRVLQHPSHWHQLHPAHDRCVPWTPLPWKKLTTSYVVTFTQRWSSSDVFHLARATLSKSSHCSKKCSQSTESQKSFTLTMVLNMQVLLLGYHPLDLKPSLSTVKLICRGHV